MTAFGFLNINKPLHMTSHDVVAQMRRTLRMKKIGHAGTLDPLASGVLVLCIGLATRLSDYIMHGTKQYTAKVHLGVETTTYDAEGDITAQHEIAHITPAMIEAALVPLRGEIDQVPPIYSAIKQGGRKLYDIARAGETATIPPRRITIHALEITDWQAPVVTLNITCSAGTYIRSLAHDLGVALGVGAHLSGLIRTASGAFSVADAVTPDQIAQAADWQQYLVAPQTALPDLPHIAVDDADAHLITTGRAPSIATNAANDTIALAIHADRVMAILRAQDSQWKPDKVFNHQ